MKGLSVWMLSKIVMLVFLLATFTTVVGFLRIANEKVSSDVAGALAMQIKDAIQTTLYTTTVSSQTVIPIPKTLPEEGENAASGKAKTFTVNVNSILADDGRIVYAAVGWGENPASYAAASSFLVSNSVVIKPDNAIIMPSSQYRYFLVSKTSGELCFQACESYDFEASCTKC